MCSLAAITAGLIDSGFDRQYVLGPDVTAYCGCVGSDDSAAKLKAENEKVGVKSAYMVNTGGKTGSCAVLLTKSAKGEPVRYVLLTRTRYSIITIRFIDAS
jgi:sugar/nucleoside kinase (ribokinase family)